MRLTPSDALREVLGNHASAPQASGLTAKREVLRRMRGPSPLSYPIVASTHQFQRPPKETSTDEDRWYDVLEQPEQERPFQRRYNICHSGDVVNHVEQNLIASANDPNHEGCE